MATALLLMGTSTEMVDVYTTRSAELTWESEGEWGSLLILPTVGTSVKLRLPFGVDTELKLLPAPYATDPPPGELWKSRMRLSFIPRTGQSNVGNALVSSSGGIAHKIVNLESMIVRFSNPLAASGFQTLSLTDAGAIGLNIEIKAGSFEVYCDDKYHGIGDNVGPFIVTNQVGMGACTYNWHSEYGTMYPDSGLESDLTVEQLPVFSTEKITVVTTAELDSETCIEVTTSVEKCYQQEFSARLSTDNFSPHLFETNWISVDVPGCEHIPPLGWLEIEVERETIGEMQHVAYVDLDGATPTLDRYLDTSELGGEKLSFAWDGIAQSSLPLADHPDEFTGPKGSFNRAMPAVVAGEPVPPPFYTLTVRLWNANKSQVVKMETWRIYIPQVVNLVPFGGEDVFREPVYSTGTNAPVHVALYTGCEVAEAEAVLARLPAMTMAFMSPDVNLRIVMADRVVGRHLSMLIVGESSRDIRRGDASAFSSRNECPYGDTVIYIEGFKKSLKRNYDGMLGGNNDVIPIPMTPEQFAKYIAPTIAHEIGHGLGLVDPKWLHATPPGRQGNHNETLTRVRIMDKGGLKYVGHRLNPSGTAYWLPDNLRYLRFVLPRGE